LYEKGKDRPVENATQRIDWTQDLDPENPQQLPPQLPADPWARRSWRA
jgi:hypothetical protein